CKGEERIPEVLKLGCQVSIAGNISYAFARAEKLGCTAMQIFARNPRQHRKGQLSEELIAVFRKRAAETKIRPVVIHIPYTLNLASHNTRFYQITIREFTEDLREADTLGAQYLVTHMGSHKGGSESSGLGRVVAALDRILNSTEGTRTEILLENTAGSGKWLGYSFAQLRYVLDRLGWPSRVGICIDTAHAWAAGYKIDDSAGVKRFCAQFEESIGAQRLKVVHLNDTREELNSRRDRHCDIGKGKIGRRGFSALLRHPMFRGAAFILETPKQDERDDERNLRTVRKLFQDGLHA
ncbi:MAG: deoxyribonuclease IV, partial [Candidatus Omnitrophica bacterium]|nr:deoxyribonuclease IV [Candidatus Omnitrophota bacterium]